LHLPRGSKKVSRNFYKLCLQVITESAGEIILTIGQYLAKIWTKICNFLLGALCMLQQSMMHCQCQLWFS